MVKPLLAENICGVLKLRRSTVNLGTARSVSRFSGDQHGIKCQDSVGVGMGGGSQEAWCHKLFGSCRADIQTFSLRCTVAVGYSLELRLPAATGHGSHTQAHALPADCAVSPTRSDESVLRCDCVESRKQEGARGLKVAIHCQGDRS